MTDIDLFLWVQDRFQVSALLKDYPLITYKHPNPNQSYINIQIQDKGRGCFGVVFDLMSSYCGIKETSQMASEIRSILRDADNVIWREYQRENQRLSNMVFKVKYL